MGDLFPGQRGDHFRIRVGPEGCPLVRDVDERKRLKTPSKGVVLIDQLLLIRRRSLRFSPPGERFAETAQRSALGASAGFRALEGALVGGPPDQAGHVVLQVRRKHVRETGPLRPGERVTDQHVGHREAPADEVLAVIQVA